MTTKQERQPDFIDKLFEGRCLNCGKPIARKVKTGREPKFCSARCRGAAFRKRRRGERIG